MEPHHSPQISIRVIFFILQPKNIKKDGLDLSKISYVTKEIIMKFSAVVILKGDILYIKDGATTGVSIIKYS